MKSILILLLSVFSVCAAADHAGRKGGDSYRYDRGAYPAKLLQDDMLGGRPLTPEEKRLRWEVKMLHKEGRTMPFEGEKARWIFSDYLTMSLAELLNYYESYNKILRDNDPGHLPKELALLSAGMDLTERMEQLNKLLDPTSPEGIRKMPEWKLVGLLPYRFSAPFPTKAALRKAREAGEKKARETLAKVKRMVGDWNDSLRGKQSYTVRRLAKKLGLRYQEVLATMRGYPSYREAKKAKQPEYYAKGAKHFFTQLMAEWKARARAARNWKPGPAFVRDDRTEAERIDAARRIIDEEARRAELTGRPMRLPFQFPQGTGSYARTMIAIAQREAEARVEAASRYEVESAERE